MHGCTPGRLHPAKKCSGARVTEREEAYICICICIAMMSAHEEFIDTTIAALKIIGMVPTANATQNGTPYR